jgi:D-3-phosphoglycerate dehydrogenase
MVVFHSTGKPLSSEELGLLLPGCDGYIAGLDTIDRSALEAADRLKVIARYGVGVDNVDLAAARARGIIVTNTPGANSASVAELTVGLMLALARSILVLAEATRRGEWPRHVGVSLSGKTVGLLGLGAVGKEVARRLRGFDCTVMAYDPLPDADFAGMHHVRLSAREEVIGQADFLSLHLPLSPETAGMVDERFLDQMKDGSFLVNTSRGELIDETALLRALERGRLRGAGLDAFSKEPPNLGDRLLALPQVIVTPHTGAHTDGAMNAMGWAAVQDCLAVLAGEAPRHRVA